MTCASVLDNDVCTPFHRLVESTNEVKAVEYFHTHCNVNIDCVDGRKRTPLIHAVAESQNNPQTIRYLLSNGANINHQDEQGWTALHYAAKENMVQNMDILLEHFPNMILRDKEGKNAYNLSQAMGHNVIAETLSMNMPESELQEADPVLQIEEEPLLSSSEIQEEKENVTAGGGTVNVLVVDSDNENEDTGDKDEDGNIDEVTIKSVSEHLETNIVDAEEYQE